MKYLFISILLFLFSFAPGQNNKQNFSDNKSFNGKNAWLYDSILCSNQFEGRKSGLIGAEKAAEFIYGKFNEWGLKPKGNNNTFIQKFPLLVTDEISIPELIIKNARRGEIKLSEGDDFALFTNSGSGNIESDVIFAGYGFCDSCWNDYKNVDVKGKIVLIVAGAPENKICNFSGKDDRNSKFKTACEHGAAALLIWNAPGTRIIKGAAIQEHNYNKNVPGAYVLDWVVRELFKGTGISFDEVLSKVNDKPNSFSLNKKVLFKAELKEIKNGFGENVIGMIEGKEKKDEYIVFGAHMDHLGKGSNGYLYSGADDNGSGTALIMELARVLAKKNDLKRNVLFIGFGAEEQGLLGSNYFVSNPTIPNDKMVMMFNFDMVGVGDGGIGISGVETMRTYWDEFYKTLTKEEKDKIKTGRAGIGGTDHTGFKLGGIPALGAASTGRHNFYHVPDDSYDYVDSTVFQSVGSIVEKFALFIINYPESLKNKYRNEKNLFDGCDVTDLNSNINIIDIKHEEKIKTALANGIKIIPAFIDGSEKNLIFDLSKYISLSAKQIENTTLLINPAELKNNVYSANMLVYPVIKNFDGNKINLPVLDKLNIKFYDYSDTKPDKAALELISNSFIISNIENASYISDNLNNNHLIIKDDYKKFSSKLKDMLNKINRKKTFFIFDIEIPADVDELSDIIKLAGMKNVHLDISSILNKNKNEVYETIKKFKLTGYSDENIREIFGENFVNFF